MLIICFLLLLITLLLVGNHLIVTHYYKFVRILFPPYYIPQQFPLPCPFQHYRILYVIYSERLTYLVVENSVGFTCICHTENTSVGAMIIITNTGE